MNLICKSCGGNLEFDIKNQEFRCVSCRAPGEIEIVNPNIEEHDFSQYGANEKSSAPYEGMGRIYCSNCGAEVIFGANQTAAKCPMCASPQIDTQKQISGVQLDGIIPFKIDKADAQRNFREWIRRLWFAPNKLKKAYQEGRLEGVYLPFWTFDADVRAVYSGEGGTRYSVRDKDGNVRIKVKWRKVTGNVSRFFDDVQICSTKEDVNKIVDMVLPFGTIKNTIPYSPAYLSGFSAEKYSVKADEAFVTAKRKMENEMRILARNDILRNFDEARVESIYADYRNVTYKNLLLPAWVSSFGYSGRQYLYIINGETGAVGGKRPYSAVKIAAAVIAVLIAVMAFLWLASGNSSDSEYVSGSGACCSQSQVLQLAGSYSQST